MDGVVFDKDHTDTASSINLTSLFTSYILLQTPVNEHLHWSGIT